MDKKLLYCSSTKKADLEDLRICIVIHRKFSNYIFYVNLLDSWLKKHFFSFPPPVVSLLLLHKTLNALELTLHNLILNTRLPNAIILGLLHAKSHWWWWWLIRLCPLIAQRAVRRAAVWAAPASPPQMHWQSETELIEPHAGQQIELLIHAHLSLVSVFSSLLQETPSSG